MQLKYLKIAIFFSLLAVTEPAWAQTEFEIDNSHTAVIFSVSHFMIGYTYGRFNKCSGNAVVDKLNPAASKFSFAIQSGSIDTNNEERDEHLKSEDFFDAEKFPLIQFESTSVTESNGTYSVTGKLKLRGVEKKVTLPLQLLGVGKGPNGNTRLGMMSKFTIKRSEFGMDKMAAGIGDDIAVTFSFEAIRKE